MTATTGTPLPDFRATMRGASPSPARAENMRAAEYRPEFSTEHTAVKITTSMMSPAPGSPNRLKTWANGACSSGSGSSFHGTMVTISRTDPTKKSRMRHTTVTVACRTPLAGSSDSAAAMTAISVPK